MVSEREITLVFGKTGMGKTQWTRQYVRALPRTVVLDPLNEYDGVWCDDVGTLLETMEKSRVFRLHCSALDRLDDVCAVCQVVGNLTLVVEEAQRVLPPHVELPEAFADIIYRGRHSGVGLVVVSQRPTTVNIAARSQWTRLVTFLQTEVSDVRWIEQTSGFGKELEINHLTRLQYLDILPSDWERKLLTISGPRKGVKSWGPSRG